MEIRPISGNEPPRPIQEGSPLWEGVQSYGKQLKQELNDLHPDFSITGSLHLNAEQAQQLVAAVYNPVKRAATLSQDPQLDKISQIFNEAMLGTKE